MNKRAVITYWKRYIKPGIQPTDWPARRESWNNLTDYLCKDGQITQKQYETWDTPKEVAPY